MIKFLKTATTLSKVPKSLGSTAALHLLLAVSVLFFAASQVCLLSAETDEESDPSEQLVHIPDLALRGALEEALGKTAGEDITQAEMTTLTRFSAQWIGVRDLTGLEYATNLTKLGLSGNLITDVSPLAGLTHVRTLSLPSNRIMDVSPLQGLTELWTLDLTNNLISDVTPLTQLTKLGRLLLDHNRIVDVSPLQGLTPHMYELELGLTNNRIVDVSPLQGLTHLYDLKLTNNQIVDVSPLAKLTGARYISLENNRIVDVSPLAKLTGLRVISLAGNPVTDFSPLYGLTTHSLRNYDFEVVPETTSESIDIPDSHLRRALEGQLSKRIGEPITRADMEGLKTLTLGDVGDFTGMETAINLTRLEIFGQGYKRGSMDWRFLTHLTHLQRLTIIGYDLLDVSPLQHLTNLRDLNLNHNRITDVSPLQHLTNLRGLILENNDIVDVSPLQHLTQLTYVNLMRNQIADFSPIQDILSNIPPGPNKWIGDQGPHFVEIPDAGLRAAIAEALNKEAGEEITTEDMEGLTSLDASNRGINDIFGIHHARNLTRLDLSDNQLAHTGFLSLRHLTYLDLSGNAIADLRNVSELEHLTHLDVSRNQLASVSLLSDLTTLRTLDVADNDISDVWHLDKLTQLETLDAANNQIVDATRLETLTALKTLNVVGNQIADVSPIAALTQLTRLFLSNNPVSDFSSLYELVPNLLEADFSYQVTELELSDTEPTWEQQTLQGIAIPDAALRAALEAALGKEPGETITQADMETLRKLKARRAGIVDLTGLEYAINLRQLDLTRNNISDVSPLSGLTQLKRLYLGRNRISDFSPIAAVTEGLSKYWNKRQKPTRQSKQVTVNADVNRDNVVDATDLDIVSRYTGRQLSSVDSGLYPDVNGDGKIDTKDVLAVTERLPLGPVSGTGQ